MTITKSISPPDHLQDVEAHLSEQQHGRDAVVLTADGRLQENRTGQMLVDAFLASPHRDIEIYQRIATQNLLPPR